LKLPNVSQAEKRRKCGPKSWISGQVVSDPWADPDHWLEDRVDRFRSSPLSQRGIRLPLPLDDCGESLLLLGFPLLSERRALTLTLDALPVVSLHPNP